ncbi:hypothetical protein WN55_04042 [Dufourea novaeangliae]|uniref:Uncharacterized protein n=1 Tax=Dufourea novaeangliae TaxID=178035 RepID=A0A154PJG0_DUFNO|nr:hypothetical protein WN55_04042 [Dufourea novaeangliae]
MWFQQDSATCHTSRETMALLHETFPGRVVSRSGDQNWPPRSYDLTPLDFFLWGFLKSKVYVNRATPADKMVKQIGSKSCNMTYDKLRAEPEQGGTPVVDIYVLYTKDRFNSLFESFEGIKRNSPNELQPAQKLGFNSVLKSGNSFGTNLSVDALFLSCTAVCCSVSQDAPGSVVGLSPALIGFRNRVGDRLGWPLGRTSNVEAFVCNTPVKVEDIFEEEEEEGQRHKVGDSNIEIKGAAAP